MNFTQYAIQIKNKQLWKSIDNSLKKINTQVGHKLNEKSSNGSGDLGLRTIALSCESSLILVDYLVDKHIIYLATCQTFYCEINFINLHSSFNIYI